MIKTQNKKGETKLYLDFELELDFPKQHFEAVT